MGGKQQIIGCRGALCTCLSFTDCGNIQSNFDGKAMDIRAKLFHLCKHPKKILFVKLYAIFPHLRLQTRFHPVSGIIMTYITDIKKDTQDTAKLY